MQLDSTFTVVAPIDTVWETLMDFERVAGCVPGAQVLNKLSDDAYQVGMKVKLGPVSMQYRGQMNVIERDAGAHRAVIQGRAQEARGQGTAQGTVTLLLTESNGATQGTVSADVDLSGKVAAMGKSVIGSVTDQMMALFAENLQAMVGEQASQPQPGASAGAAGTAGGPTDAEGTSAPGQHAAATSAGATAGAFVRPSGTQAGASLNAIAFVRGMVMNQLRSPGKLLGLLALVALVSYRLGRRGSGRGDS